jgi:hypothetical protein
MNIAKTFMMIMLIFSLCGVSYAKALDTTYYGTQYSEGDNGYGYVFSTDNLKTINPIYSFCSKPNCFDGGNPVGNLIVLPSGKIIGTTSTGGRDHAGTIFILEKVDSVWTETPILHFCTFWQQCGFYGYPMGTLKLVDDNLIIGTLSNPNTGKHMLYTYDMDKQLFTAYYNKGD